MYLPIRTRRQVASGSVAAGDIAVTLTAGSADVDLSSATIPRNYKGNLIQITDANGKMIQGFAYTNGAGTVQNIVSAKGGSTRNWTSQAAGFDDTTNCTYKIFKTLAVQVLDQVETSGKFHVSTVAGGAMMFSEDIDYSAYAGTGEYDITGYDATNAMAFHARTGAVGGGEDLGADVFAGAGAFTVGTGWELEDGYSVAGGKLEKIVGTGYYATHPATMPAGQLWKSSIDVDAISGIGGFAIAYRGLAAGESGITISTTGTKTEYHTQITAGTGCGVSASAAKVITIDNLVIKPLTNVPVTGLLLRNLEGEQSVISTGTGNINAITKVKVVYIGD